MTAPAPAIISVGAKPWAVAIDPVDNRLYAANEFDNTVSVVDLCTHAVVATLPSGIGPRSISVDRKTGAAYVVDFNSNDVTVIAGDKVTQTIPVGRTPGPSWPTPMQERCTSPTRRTAPSESSTRPPTRRSRPSRASSSHGVSPSPAARSTSPMPVQNLVRAVNLDTLRPQARSPSARGRRAWPSTPTANRFYVTNIEDGTAFRRRPRTMYVVGTIGVGLSPFQIAVDPKAQPCLHRRLIRRHGNCRRYRGSARNRGER